MKKHIILLLFSLSLNAEEIIVESSVVTNRELPANSHQERSLNVERAENSTSESLSREKELTTSQEPNSITELIQKVKMAEGKDRRALMNQLKLELRAMNKEKRAQSMKELKNALTKGSNNPTPNQQREHEENHEKKHEEHCQGVQQGQQQEHRSHQPQFRAMHGYGQHRGRH